MSVHKTRDGKYETRWREGSRNRSRRFDRKSDAEDWDRHARRQKQIGNAVPPRVGTETLAEFFRRWISTRHRLAPRTRALYEELFERHAFDQIGYAPLSALTPERMEAWQTERMNAGAGAEALAKTTKILSQMFDRAVHQRKMPANSVAGLEKPEVPHQAIEIATPRQVEAIRVALLERERMGDAVLVSLMAYGGFRPGEALALQWEDFSQGRQFWVSRSLEDDGSLRQTKNGKERLRVLPEAAAQDLLAWRVESGAEGLIFPRAKDGRGWTKTDRNNWRRRWFGPAAEAAGLGSFPPKNLRHSCASLMIAAGRPPTEVAEALGHSLAVSVRVYQRLMREMEGQPVRSVDEMIAEARTSREHVDAKDARETAKSTTGESEKMA